MFCRCFRSPFFVDTVESIFSVERKEIGQAAHDGLIIHLQEAVVLAILDKIQIRGSFKSNSYHIFYSLFEGCLR